MKRAEMSLELIAKAALVLIILVILIFIFQRMVGERQGNLNTIGGEIGTRAETCSKDPNADGCNFLNPSGNNPDSSGGTPATGGAGQGSGDPT